MKTLKKFLFIVFLIAVAVILFLICRKNTETPTVNDILLDSDSSREAYLNLQGWNVTEISHEQVMIPQDFSGTYSSYALIQEKQNLPLSEYKGKSVDRFLYNVKNYNGNYDIYAELLICNNKLIAAALIEQQPDGFIKEIY